MGASSQAAAGPLSSADCCFEGASAADTLKVRVVAAKAGVALADVADRGDAPASAAGPVLHLGSGEVLFGGNTVCRFLAAQAKLGSAQGNLALDGWVEWEEGLQACGSAEERAAYGLAAFAAPAAGSFLGGAKKMSVADLVVASALSCLDTAEFGAGAAAVTAWLEGAVGADAAFQSAKAAAQALVLATRAAARVAATALQAPDLETMPLLKCLEAVVTRAVCKAFPSMKACLSSPDPKIQGLALGQVAVATTDKKGNRMGDFKVRRKRYEGREGGEERRESARTARL